MASARRRKPLVPESPERFGHLEQFDSLGLVHDDIVSRVGERAATSFLFDSIRQFHRDAAGCAVRRQLLAEEAGVFLRERPFDTVECDRDEGGPTGARCRSQSRVR
jgi:hypothetical protein